MVIDFSKIDFTKRPKFILRNLDDSAIGYLSNVLKPKGTFCYNEISEISFEYPSQINGEKLDEYDLLTGMRVIDVQGYGQFILRNPEETDDGGTHLQLKVQYLALLCQKFRHGLLEQYLMI